MTSNHVSEQDDLIANLRADYEQTNQQITMLADIRFKLLALVPTLTAAAALLTGASVAHGTVLAIGILGFITVFAIAMYDLRNSQIYDTCIGRARQLEKLLHMPSFRGNHSGGLYNERPRHTISLFEIEVWHDRALAIIYSAALGGWFFIITSSFIFLLSSIFQWPGFPLPNQYIEVVYVASILIAALVAYAFIRQFHQIEAIRSRSRMLTVHSVDMPDTINNRTPNNGYKFVSVHATLTNRWKRQLKYNLLDLKLRDNQDFSYKYSDVATEQQNLTGTLQPGQPRNLGIVYEIQECNIPSKLVYTPSPRFLQVQQIIDLTENITRNIILIRHGERDRNYPPEKEKDAPLAHEGKEKVDLLNNQLARQNIRPDIYLTSKYEHAKQTAERLSDGRPNIVYPIDALTPHSKTKTNGEFTPENIFDAIIDEAKQAGVELSQLITVAIVGHVPRLDWILTSLTSSTTEPSLNRAEAVWGRADSFSDFRQGKGVVQDWISGNKGSGGRGFAVRQAVDFREVE